MTQIPAARSALSFSSWASAIISGAGMAASMARPGWAILAWAAWIPLLRQLLPVSPEESCAHPFRLGFATGLVFWLLTIHWLVHVTVIGMVAMSLYLALYMGTWAFFMTRIRARWRQPKGWIHLGVACLGASAWVGLEWMRGWMLGGFPWNFAAVSQHRNLGLIQICEWTGVYGVSFVVLFVNHAFWLTWRRLWIERFSARSWRYELSAAILLVAFCLFVGMRHLLRSHAEMAGGARRAVILKLALIQPDIPQEVKYEPLSQEEQRRRLEELTGLASALKPDWVIWPETAVVAGPTYNLDSRYWLESLVRRMGVPIFFGTVDADVANHEGTSRRSEVKYFNAAVSIDEKGQLGTPYHKLHLVPFGEYVPFDRWMPWLRWLTPISTGFHTGAGPVLFDCKGVKMGPLICFEDTFPHLSGAMSKNGADVLINLTNDAWFKESMEARLHAANAVFRAIETRRPLVRCTNSGLTLVISASGEIIQPLSSVGVGPHGVLASPLPAFCEGFAICMVKCFPDAPQTFFTRYGDWFPVGCWIIFIVGAATCGASAWSGRGVPDATSVS